MQTSNDKYIDNQYVAKMERNLDLMMMILDYIPENREKNFDLRADVLSKISETSNLIRIIDG